MTESELKELEKKKKANNLAFGLAVLWLILIDVIIFFIMVSRSTNLASFGFALLILIGFVGVVGLGFVFRKQLFTTPVILIVVAILGFSFLVATFAGDDRSPEEIQREKANQRLRSQIGVALTFGDPTKVKTHPDGVEITKTWIQEIRYGDPQKIESAPYGEEIMWIHQDDQWIWMSINDKEEFISGDDQFRALEGHINTLSARTMKPGEVARIKVIHYRILD